MRKTTIVLLILTVLAIGCATGVVLRDQVAPAVSAQNVEAPGQYSECIVVTVRVHAAAHFNQGKQVEQNRVAQVPAGWTPIGGGGFGTAGGAVTMCR